MLTVNLLSDDAKKIVRYEVMRRLVARLGFIVPILIGVFTLLLLPTYYQLIYQQDEIARLLSIEQASETAVKAKRFEGQAKELNQRLSTIGNFDRQVVLPTSVLLRIFSSLNERIVLTSLTHDFAKREVALIGNAERREDFLSFERSLRRDPAFKDIISPITNLLTETNVVFSLRITFVEPLPHE